MMDANPAKKNFRRCLSYSTLKLSIAKCETPTSKLQPEMMALYIFLYIFQFLVLIYSISGSLASKNQGSLPQVMLLHLVIL